jgi:hypothetical protein
MRHCGLFTTSLSKLCVFIDTADFQFVLDQTGANTVLNLSMTDQDASYGFLT